MFKKLSANKRPNGAQKPQQAPPLRSMDEIRAETHSMYTQAGEQQFLEKMAQAKLFELNKRLAELHAEANRTEAAAKSEAEQPKDEAKA